MGLIRKLGGLLRQAPVPSRTLNHAMGVMTKTIDASILSLPGSRDRLMPAMEQALGYYEDAIAAIPGPVAVSAQRHGSDPVLSALFPAADDIVQGLGRSIAVRNSLNWFVERKHESVCAVLGMRLRPGADAGGGLRFADHTFRSLAASDEDARECLCEAAFTGLINAFATRLKERQREWRLLHTERQLHQELRKTNEGANTGALAANDAFAHHLDPAGKELTAEDALETLVEWLQSPEQQLRVEAGDGHPPVAASANGSGFQLPWMSTIDRRTWLVCLTQFSLEEALGALAKETQTHRYILI